MRPRARQIWQALAGTLAIILALLTSLPVNVPLTALGVLLLLRTKPEAFASSRAPKAIASTPIVYDTRHAPKIGNHRAVDVRNRVV